MKKRILYFKKLNFQKKNLKYLSSKFIIVKPNEVKRKNLIKKIISIFLPMDNYYKESFFSKFSNLRSVVTPTTGDIHIDKEYLLKKKIKLINLSSIKSLKKITTTSELTIGHIINLTRKIILIHNNFLKDMIFRKYNNELSNRSLTLGIVGLGRIGSHVATRASALGFKVIYFDPFIKNKKFKKIKSLNKLIKSSNILSIHMHYDRKFYQKFNAKTFKNLKKPSYFINTSRGEFVNEIDLIKCLKNKTLSGAGLDVVSGEHLKNFRKRPSSNKLINFKQKNKNINLFISPKQGGSNKNAWELSEKLIIKKFINYEKNYI